MSNRVLIGVVAAIVALCGWILWIRPAPAGQPSLSIADSETAIRGPDRPAEALAAPEQDPAVVLDRSAVPLREDGVVAAASPRKEWWLVGRLLDFDAGASVAAELEVNRWGWSTVKSPAGLDGNFEIDVTELFGTRGPDQAASSASPNGSAPEVELEVWVRHPDYMPVREMIRSEAIAPTMIPGERIELRRDIRVRRAACVTGRVRVEGAPDAQAVEVSLRNQNASGPIGVVSSVRCDADGRYRMRAPGSGEYELRARSRGYRSAAVRVLLDDRDTLELPDLVLEAGLAEIRGRVELPPGVTVADQTHDFDFDFDWPQGVQVHGHPRNRTEAAKSALGTQASVLIHAENCRSFAELRASVPNESQIAQVGADGKFVLAGLDVGEWELQIHGIRSSALLAMKQPTIVHAPARDVILGSDLCRITAVVTEDARPVKDAQIAWRSELDGDRTQFNNTQTDDQGRVVVIGDVSMDYSATVSRDGRREASIAIPAAGRPKDHSLEVALTRSEPPARLVLRAPEGARPPKTIHVRLTPAQRPDSEPGHGHLPRLDRRCEWHEGAYTLEDLNAGAYAIEVGPSDDRGPVAFYGGFFMTEHYDVELAPGAAVERMLALKSGGRLRIEVEGFTEGEHLVPFELVDFQGVRVGGPNVVAEEGDGRGTFYARDGELSLKFPNAIQPCLDPGTYEVRVQSTEYDVDPVRVEVRALETATARLSARRR